MESNIPTGLVGALRLFNWTHKHASFTESFMEFHNLLKKVLEPLRETVEVRNFPIFKPAFVRKIYRDLLPHVSGVETERLFHRSLIDQYNDMDNDVHHSIRKLWQDYSTSGLTRLKLKWDKNYGG